MPLVVHGGTHVHLDGPDRRIIEVCGEPTRIDLYVRLHRHQYLARRCSSYAR